MSWYGEKSPWDAARDVHGSEIAMWRGSRRRVRPSKTNTLQEARKRHLEKLSKVYAKEIDRGVRTFLRAAGKNGLTDRRGTSRIAAMPVNGSRKVLRGTTQYGRPEWIVNVEEFWPTTDLCKGAHRFFITSHGVWLFVCCGTNLVPLEWHQSRPTCTNSYGYGMDTMSRYESKLKLNTASSELISSGIAVEVAYSAMAMILGAHGIQLPRR